MQKPIPDFPNENAEREFWDSHDSADYVDWSQARPVAFSKLRPSMNQKKIRENLTLSDEIRVPIVAAEEMHQEDNHDKK